VNLTVSVAMVVTHRTFKEELPMLSATSRIAGRLRAATTFAALAACLAAGSVVTARAALPEQASSVTVDYRDLNLATQQGSRELYARITSAARQVCGQADPRNLEALATAHACKARAIAQAVRDVNSPNLAAMFAASVKRG
jgi:UrcA family protein